MPIYEYTCPDCEIKFELIRPLSQSSEAASCPKCEKSAERVLSSFACFSTDERGLPSMLGGNPCSSCGASNCDTCNI